jgi:hypothetical protein
MQTVGDQRILGLQQLQPQRRGSPAMSTASACVGDQFLEIGALGRTGRGFAPARQAVLEFRKPLVEPRSASGGVRWVIVTAPERRLASVASDGLLEA